MLPDCSESHSCDVELFNKSVQSNMGTQCARKRQYFTVPQSQTHDPITETKLNGNSGALPHSVQCMIASDCLTESSNYYPTQDPSQLLFWRRR